MQKLKTLELLEDYMRLVEPTDKLPANDIRPTLLGLFGEVGSIMATAKKLHREGPEFAGYRSDTIEEFGDALWYFTALCRRCGVGVRDVFAAALKRGARSSMPLVRNRSSRTTEAAGGAVALPEIDTVLFGLGRAAAKLLTDTKTKVFAGGELEGFAASYLAGLRIVQVSIGEVISVNTDKARGRFISPRRRSLPTFDHAFDEEERIPRSFEIEIIERKSGKSYMRWNGVFIGDPLTDNIRDPDGYRFHDVFHFAHAAILNWSPTFRALIKHKRKSNPKIEEAQDSGRAIVVEEGLTAWIFSRAKERGFFHASRHISFDVLKTIQQFTAGYEVEDCPLSLWEDAILQGYSVFRKVRAKGGGKVLCDRVARNIRYKPSRRVI